MAKTLFIFLWIFSLPAGAFELSDDQKYLFFSSREDARNFMDQQGTFKVLDLKSPIYPKVEIVFNKVFPEILKSAPPDFKKYSRPEFIITNDSITSFVISKPGVKGRPYLVVIAEEATKDLNRLYFTLAHELSHLILQSTADITVYSWDGHPEAEEKWNEWYTHMRMGGFNQLPQFNGVPLAELFDAELAFLPQVLRKLVDENECSQARSEINTAGKWISGAVISKLTNKYVLEEAVLNNLSLSTGKIKAAVEKCFLSAKITPEGVLKASIELLFKVEIKNIDENDEATKELADQLNELFDFKKNPEPAKAIWQLTTSSNAERLRIENKINDQLRVYTEEDFADAEAVKVMDKLKMSVRSHYPFNGMSEEEMKTCTSWIDQKKPIPYGSLGSRHHSPCWRFARAISLAKFTAVDGL